MTLRNDLLLGLVMILAAGCAPQKSGHLWLSVANARTPVAPMTTVAPVPSATNQLAELGIEITALHVAVREFELDDGTCPSPTAATNGAQASTWSKTDDDSDDDECETEVGPVFVSLDREQLDELLGGGMPQAVKSAHLEPGLYTELEVKVRPFTEKDYARLGTEGSTLAQEALRDDSGDHSIAMDLYVKAQERAVTCRFDARFELERHVKIEIKDDGSVSNLTFGLFFDSLFLGVDPSAAADDPCAFIASRLAGFLDVYEDDDHDGKCDHDGACDHGGKCDHHEAVESLR